MAAPIPVDVATDTASAVDTTTEPELDPTLEYSYGYSDDEEGPTAIDPIELDEIRNMVSEYLAVDNDIKKMQGIIRERRKYKQEMAPIIAEFMKKYNVAELNSTDGIIKRYTSTRTKPLNKDATKEKLAAALEDEAKAAELSEFLYANREKVQVETIKRCKRRMKKGNK